MGHAHCFTYTFLQNARGKAQMRTLLLTSNDERDRQETAGGVFLSSAHSWSSALSSKVQNRAG
jgi:hypothetical protein